MEYTVNKNSGKQRQHPREDTHIHSVEQDQPQGMKNRETTKYTYRRKPPGKLYPTSPHKHSRRRYQKTNTTTHNK